MNHKDEIREALEREATGPESRRFFQDVLRRDSALAPFDGPEDLLAALHAPAEDRDDLERKDAILIALLRAYQEGGPGRASVATILLLALWPALVTIFSLSRRRHNEPEELWADLRVGFLARVERYPIERRPARVAENLRLDTLRELRTAERHWSQHDLAVAAVAHRLGQVAPRRASASEGTEELLAIACARAVREGRFSAKDGLIFAATRLEGRSVQAVAGELGLSYEATKRRRYKVELALRALVADPSRSPPFRPRTRALQLNANEN